ncbi:MAG: RNA 2',3'-cyclic phosphodiesterase [Candidatus Anstonellaceae archaeon]
MRLFVAVLVPEEARLPVANAASCLQNALGARMVDPKNYHFTLKFIGDASLEQKNKIEEALAGIRFAPFEVKLMGAGAFPSIRVPRAIWIGGESEGAETLAHRVDEALAFLGLEREKFTLHLTVARSKGIADIEEFLKIGEVCSFKVNSFCLMKSTLAAHGAIYEVLREFPADNTV